MLCPPNDIAATFSISNIERQCVYLELRGTPCSTPHLMRMQYITTILDEIERYPVSSAACILALDRRMPQDVAGKCIEIAIDLRMGRRRIVGVDLSGDPAARYLHGHASPSSIHLFMFPTFSLFVSCKVG